VGVDHELSLLIFCICNTRDFSRFTFSANIVSGFGVMVFLSVFV